MKQKEGTCLFYISYSGDGALFLNVDAAWQCHLYDWIPTQQYRDLGYIGQWYSSHGTV